MVIRGWEFIDKVMEAIGVGRTIGPVISITITANCGGRPVLTIERAIEPAEADRLAALMAGGAVVADAGQPERRTS